MGVTGIKKIENRSGATVALFDMENSGVPGHGVPVGPGASLPVDMWVPWAGAGDFPGKHLRLDVAGQARFWIWQANNADGDHVRFSTDGRWHDRGERVDGVSVVDGDRTLVVLDGAIQVVDLPAEVAAAVRGCFDARHYLRVGQQDQAPMPSNPRSAAVAFSVAGPASDAGAPVYRDSGKRYDLAIEGGVVWVTDPAGQRTALRDAVSFEDRRLGVTGPAPAFDLVAASNGRILAKEAGADRFWFTTLDQTFLHSTPRGNITVPSTYFKLDPEYHQPGAQPGHLTAALDGSFANHPAAERFSFFRMVLGLDLVDMMVVQVRPRVWHRLDPRPSIGMLNLQTAVLRMLDSWLTQLLAIPTPPMPLRTWAEQLKADVERRLAAPAPDSAPPPVLPTYDHVRYRDDTGSEFALPSIAYRRVLDIGVGHVHQHEQYSGITGGELQPVRVSETYANGYRLFNGPVADGDGYIDGTCNVYALVELVPKPGAPAYALLYQDEQSYFSQRWRQVGPDDKKGLMFALVTDLQNPMYTFDRNAFWDPFTAGAIGPKSRLAVAAQVLLVTGDDARADTRSRIYSINFSWSTMDRTWRSRPLPPGAEIRYFDAAADAAGPVPVTGAPNAVHPQTVRLREDMTIHLKGTRARLDGQGAEAGRWYQRYLPAGNPLSPPPAFSHPWRFMPEPTYALADRFSHLGVYAQVDSRSQYYVVQPASAADEQALAAVAGGPWVDSEYALTRWAPKFEWSAPMHLLTPSNLVPGVLDRRPPSIFNPETRLRVVKRGARWIATFADKRDDDLLPFAAMLDGNDFKPRAATLTAAGRSARVTLVSHVAREAPPALAVAELTWSGLANEAVSVRLWAAPGRSLDDIARLRIAGLVPGSPGAVTMLRDADVSAGLTPLGGGCWEHRWTPTGDVSALAAHTTAAGADRLGTSLWLEDIVGHVATADEMRWTRTGPKQVVVDRTATVREADSLVDTGVDVRPGDEYQLDASGSIWAGVAFTGNNGPAGWTNVDHNTKFPLHDGPDAHPFCLIGRFGSGAWFYVGNGRGRGGFADTAAKRLYLRTNDDSPGNGNGSFSCRIRVWR